MTLRDRHDDELPMSGSRPVDEDVRRELEFHIERRTEELIAGGHTPEAARAEARALFGDRAGVEAECREIENRRRANGRRARRWEALRQDAVIGLRMLRRSPVFTLTALATLALGTGATTAVFSLVNQVLLRPLPYHQPDRLVDVIERNEKGGWAGVSWTNMLDIEREVRSFAAIATYGSSKETVLGAGAPLRTEVAGMSRGFFRVFPVAPSLGRLPAPEEHVLGANPVAVVSHAFWRDHLGAPASLAGVRITSGRVYDVIGVLPAGFDFPARSQVWVPWELFEPSTSRTSHNGEVVARLAPGATVEKATRDVDVLFARLAREYPSDFDAVGSTVTPLQASLTKSARAPLTLLMAASLLLLLTACTNLAGAMLARGTARAAELAVRSALGATRTRLVRQLVTECSLLAIGGGVIGVLLGRTMLRVFSVVAPGDVPLAGIQLDGRVIAFTIAVVAFTAIAFGWAPAMRLSDGQAAKLLREGGRGTSRLRPWNVLVAGEVALAVMLLAGSTLLIRSFGQVMQERLGFEPASVTSAEVNLPSATYASRGEVVPAFHQRVLGALAGTPGVDAAGFLNIAPLGGNFMSGSLEIEGKPLDKTGQYNGYALYRVVGGEAFRALGIPLISGRTFAPTDDRAATPVTVVNESFAKTAWPREDAIGKRVRPTGMDGSADEPWHVVIGVVGDARSGSPIDRYRDTYYFDHRQRPAYRAQSVTYVVRSTMQLSTVGDAIRNAVRAVDPNVPLDVRAMQDVVRGTLSDRRFTMIVLASFAILAVLLAVIGIFAVVSYSVAQRTREIGVRLALGSTPGGVRLMVITDALHAVVPGLLIGAALTMSSAGVLRTMLYGVSPFDPVALVGAVVLLALAAVASSLIPAVRSTRIDPMLAIRGQ